MLYFLCAVIFVAFNFYEVPLLPASLIVKLFVDYVLLNMCLAAIFVTISCLFSQQAIIAIVNIVLVLLMTTGSQRLYAQLSQPQYLERYETVNSEWIDENGKWLFAGVRIFCSVRIRAIWLGPFPAARRENICRTTSAASGSGSRWFSEVSDFR